MRTTLDDEETINQPNSGSSEVEEAGESCGGCSGDGGDAVEGRKGSTGCRILLLIIVESTGRDGATDGCGQNAVWRKSAFSFDGSGSNHVIIVIVFFKEVVRDAHWWIGSTC